MSLRFSLYCLRKDELQHELRIRGLKVTSEQTVKDLRSCLRQFMRLESSNRSFSYPHVNLNAQEEFDICDGKFSEIIGLRGNPGVNFQSLYSRLVHLCSRLARVSVGDLEESKREAFAKLRSSAATALDELKTTPLPEELVVTSAVNGESSSESDSGESVRVPRFRNPLVRTSTTNSLAAGTSTYYNLQKWNLKFTGDPKGTTVHSFLETVEDMRKARNVPYSALFDSAIDLFADKALMWYRSNRDRVGDWQELAALLVKHYEPPDYRARLFRDILGRTQAPSESIVDFLTCMNSMFRRYGSLDENARLDILVRNLAPFYSTQLPTVTNLQELEDECLKLEVKKFRSDSYIPPPRRRQDYADPDLAFVESCSNALPSTEQRDSVMEVSNAATKARDAQITCWNCRKVGHTRHSCREPKRIVCFRCGEANVTVRTCPSCSVSGNGIRRSK